MEIERKFILRSFGSVLRKKAHARIPIEQWFLKEFRIRKAGADYFITIKKGSGLVRYEWEEKIPRWFFDLLKNADTCGSVLKTRYLIPYGRHTLELDVYKGKLFPLITLECEFKSVKDARAFQMPCWVGDYKEVTGNQKFTNRFLAKNSLSDTLRGYYRK